MQENSMEYECQSPPQHRAGLHLSCESVGFVMAVIILLQNGTSLKKSPSVALNMNVFICTNFTLWYIFSDIKHMAV